MTPQTNNGGMNMMDMMTMQLMSLNIMKSDGSNNGIMGIILIMIIKFMIDTIPTIAKTTQNLVTKYIEKKKYEYENKIENALTNKKINGTITFEKTSAKNTPEIIQALIRHIANLKSSEKILYNDDFYVVNKNEFLIEPNIYCSVLDWNKNTEGIIDEYVFKLYSYTYNVEELKDYTQKIYENYIQEQSNKLGKQQYFFNEIIVDIPKNIDGTYRMEMAKKHLLYEMTPFYTNKSLNNVFGAHLNILKDRINLFVNNPSWYKEKGIPYTLGILLSGPPGTGKTSAIKAIANDTKRHIFNISLREYTTQSQLKHCFYSKEVKIVRNGVNETIYIPIEKRIYIIEDIDALTDVVLDRKIKKDRNNQKEQQRREQQKDINTQSQILDDDIILNNIEPFTQNNIDSTNYTNYMNAYSGGMNYGHNNNYQYSSEINNNNRTKSIPTSYNKKKINNENSEKITLSFLLNLLDGVLETPGRILIITSNHPELLDPALVRPGRIDIKLIVDKCTREMIYDMFNYFYNNENINLDDWDYITKITPAEVSSIMQANYNNYENAKKMLIEKTKKINTKNHIKQNDIIEPNDIILNEET